MAHSASLTSQQRHDGENMTRERFHWILAGLLIGIAFAVLGITPSMSDTLPTGQALVEFREKQLKAGAGAMEFLAQYDGSDPEKAKAAAKVLDDNANAILSWFPEGSGPGGAGIEKTRAKPEIWSNWADFQAKAKGFDDAVGELVSVAGGPDADQIHAAVGKVGEACKACHESYRGPKND